MLPSNWQHSATAALAIKFDFIVYLVFFNAQFNSLKMEREKRPVSYIYICIFDSNTRRELVNERIVHVMKLH